MYITLKSAAVPLLLLLPQDELVKAAQQELQDKRRQRQKLPKAKKDEVVHAAQELMQAPAGFAQFAARLLRFYRQYGIEWPTVTVTYRDLGISTKVCILLLVSVLRRHGRLS